MKFFTKFSYCLVSDASDTAAVASDVGDEGRAESPTADVDAVAAKRRRLTCSMESVEDKPEKMDDKNCSTSAGTHQLIS